MYKIDMSNKHKKTLVAFVDLAGGESVMVFFDTISKFNSWLKNSIGIESYGLYNASGNDVTIRRI